MTSMLQLGGLGRTILALAATGTALTWNSGDKNASITLSAADRTATGTSTAQLVRSATGKSSGKWYFEVTVTTAVAFGSVGVAKAATSLSTYVGGDADSYGKSLNHTYTNGVSNNTGVNSVNNGDVVGIAVDLDAGKIWMACNNNWDGSGDPAGGTNERYSGLSGTYLPASSPGAAAQTINATFVYAPPSGFAAWE